MEASILENQNDNVGPVGISRSGRVRRKSSKLNDFQSHDEMDPVSKKKPSPSKQPLKQSKVLLPASSSSSSSSDSSNSDSSDSDSDINEKNESLKYLDEWNENVNPGEVLNLKDNEEDYNYDDHIQVDDYSSRDDSNFSQAQSLYFSEKKKAQMKDSTVTKQKKAERKDKGQSRLTAYMLWAKATRPSILEANPSLDFTAVNRRLGEMWTRVTAAQKMSFERKAKQMLARTEKVKKGKAMISTGKVSKATPSKATPTKKGPIQQLYRVVSKNEIQQHRSATGTTLANKTLAQTPKSTKANVSSIDAGSPPSSFKVTGTTPIDVSAHLKLLGESLNNIGQKLKEHEGQIAVSGSLSVLLDSMLCVLGPLACLTNQLDETNGAISEDTLKGILDNIAYIMPGIF